MEELQGEVRRLAKSGIAILVTDHNVQQTLPICDRAYILHEGRNEGAKDLINDAVVRQAYLASTFRVTNLIEHLGSQIGPRGRQENPQRHDQTSGGIDQHVGLWL